MPLDKNSRSNWVYIIQIVTVVEVTIGNCFPDVWEILPDAIAVIETHSSCHPTQVSRRRLNPSQRGRHSINLLGKAELSRRLARYRDALPVSTQQSPIQVVTGLS